MTDINLTGTISAASLAGNLSNLYIPKDVTEYDGPTSITPSAIQQQFETARKLVNENLVVEGAKLDVLEATENGTYRPDGDAVGFSQVDVDVNPDLRPLSVSENGQYSPDGFDGYESVVVDVEPNLTSLAVTENGLYLPESGVDGFDRVSVDVPQEITLDDLATGAKPTGDVVITAERITRSNTFYGLPMTTASLPNLTTVSGANSFQGCENLTLIDAPNLEVISGNGFVANCSNLASVNLPNLREITGQAIFQNTNKLKEIILPNVTKITSYIANGRNNTLYGGVIKLGKKAELGTRTFNGCMKTGNIYLPWSEGEVSGAPWEAPTGVTIHYDAVYDENWNVISST